MQSTEHEKNQNAWSLLSEKDKTGTISNSRGKPFTSSITQQEITVVSNK